MEVLMGLLCLRHQFRTNNLGKIFIAKVQTQPPSIKCIHFLMLLMMVLCRKAGSLAFTPPGDEMSEVVSRCLPHRQLWVSNLSKVATQWREVDSNLRPFGCNAQNLPLHHGVPYIIYII